MRNLYVLAFFGLLLGGMVMGQGFNFSVLDVSTDRANIPVNEVISGGPPPQGIPALGFTGSFNGRVPPTPAPKFISADEASAWLEPQEPVLAFEMNGEARAYPLQILMWHEIANDVVGGVPVAVTFCPLCNSAFAYDRRVPLTRALKAEVLAKNPDATFVELDGAFLEAYADEVGEEAVAEVVAAIEVTFGTSGMLFNSNLVMFDSVTSTLWVQLAAEGNVGTLTGVKLLRYPVQIVSFSEFREAFPEGVVLSRDTGFSRRYGKNPYIGYDRVDQPPFLFSGPTDGRLPPKLRVVSLELGGEPVAYPFSVLEEVRVVNDTVGGVPIVVMWMEGTASALDRLSISGGKDVGAVAVFRRELDGKVLTFEWNGEAFVDRQSGSTWNLFGEATSGPLEGTRLKPVIHDNTLWFAWAAFKPETRVYGIATEQ